MDSLKFSEKQKKNQNSRLICQFITSINNNIKPLMLEEANLATIIEEEEVAEVEAVDLLAKNPVRLALTTYLLLL